MTQTLLYQIYAGDVLVIEIPAEFLEGARLVWPESVGYRFVRIER